MKDQISLPPSWKEFYTLKDGSKNVRMAKKGNDLEYQFKYKGKWYLLWSVSEAAIGGGVMNWEDYKDRTKQM